MLASTAAPGTNCGTNWRVSQVPVQPERSAEVRCEVCCSSGAAGAVLQPRRRTDASLRRSLVCVPDLCGALLRYSRIRTTDAVFGVGRAAHGSGPTSRMGGQPPRVEQDLMPSVTQSFGRLPEGSRVCFRDCVSNTAGAACSSYFQSIDAIKFL